MRFSKNVFFTALLCSIFSSEAGLRGAQDEIRVRNMLGGGSKGSNHDLSRKEVESRLEDLFKKIDTNHNDALSFDEIKEHALMVQSERKRSERLDARRMVKRDIAQFDQNNDGLLTLNESIEVLKQIPQEHDHQITLKDVFGEADQNSDGYLNEEELLTTLHPVPLHIDREGIMTDIVEIISIDAEGNEVTKNNLSSTIDLPDFIEQDVQDLIEIVDRDTDGQLALNEIRAKPQYFVSSLAHTSELGNSIKGEL